MNPAEKFWPFDGATDIPALRVLVESKAAAIARTSQLLTET